MDKHNYDRILPDLPQWSWREWAIWSAGAGLFSLLMMLTGDKEFKDPIQRFGILLFMPPYLGFIFYGLYYLSRRTRYLTRVQKVLRPIPVLDVFISHSSKDSPLAAALIRLLETAFDGLEIRCTSVDGFRLTIGDEITERLRVEVLASKCFIGLITPTSIQSTYVLFELGARWGAGLRLVPILAQGVDATPLTQ